MVTFNNELEMARRSLLSWQWKELLTCVTVVRDVFGKLSFLVETQEYPDEDQRVCLESLLERDLGKYYAKKICWENMPAKKRRYLDPMISLMKEGRKEWCVEQGILFYLSERSIAKKAWVCQARQETIWPYEDTLEGTKPKVVTFYSFKGGMGRTTTLASVALQLARKGKNVIMVDTDIEAPGLATLFLDEELIENGVLDYLLEYTVDKETDISNYVIDVAEPGLLREEDGKIYVLPAGKVDGNYLQKLARIDYQDHREGALRDSMCSMLKAIAEKYDVDYILVDARAGFHDMGGIAVSQLPHGAVLFGNNSRQSWDGIKQVIRTIAESHEDMPILIADCMCENRTSAAFSAEKERFVTKAYEICVENYYREEEGIPGVESVNVAHAPVFLPFDSALRQEVVLYSRGGQGEEERVEAFVQCLLSEDYQSVAVRIEEWFGEGA